MFGQRRREFVLVGEAIEAAATHHGDAEWIGDTSELGHHARGLADPDQPGVLPSAAVQPEFLGGSANRRQELLNARPAVGFSDYAAVVADCLHGNQTRTART